MKSSLAAILITKNEEVNIPRCLRSIVSIVDEVVVVDSGSRDNTVALARKYKAKVFERKFDNYASQRNFAISCTHCTWILSLDADEEIPEALGREIREAIEQTKFAGFLIPRRNIIFGKEIKHTRWSPDMHIWLFKKTEGRFKNSVHEEVTVNGKVGSLKNAKIHHSHKNISEFIEKANSYTDYEAQDKFKKGQKFSYFRMFYHPARSFIGRYFLKQGYLDGWRGFVLSYLRAMYQFTVWVKLWQLEQKK